MFSADTTPGRSSEYPRSLNLAGYSAEAVGVSLNARVLRRAWLAFTSGGSAVQTGPGYWPVAERGSVSLIAGAGDPIGDAASDARDQVDGRLLPDEALDG